MRNKIDLKLTFSRFGIHWRNGSPINSDGHWHTGLWFITLQFALKPHAPVHGFWHFWLIQAWFRGQSEFKAHSGRHVGGLPKNPEIQEHTAWPLFSRHKLFGPQGDDSHGDTGGTISTISVLGWCLENK